MKRTHPTWTRIGRKSPRLERHTYKVLSNGTTGSTGRRRRTSHQPEFSFSFMRWLLIAMVVGYLIPITNGKATECTSTEYCLEDDICSGNWLPDQQRCAGSMKTCYNKSVLCNVNEIAWIKRNFDGKIVDYCICASHKYVASQTQYKWQKEIDGTRRTTILRYTNYTSTFTVTSETLKTSLVCPNTIDCLALPQAESCKNKVKKCTQERGRIPTRAYQCQGKEAYWCAFDNQVPTEILSITPPTQINKQCPKNTLVVTDNQKYQKLSCPSSPKCTDTAQGTQCQAYRERCEEIDTKGNKDNPEVHICMDAFGSILSCSWYCLWQSGDFLMSSPAITTNLIQTERSIKPTLCFIGTQLILGIPVMYCENQDCANLIQCKATGFPMAKKANVCPGKKTYCTIEETCQAYKGEEKCVKGIEMFTPIDIAFLQEKTRPTNPQPYQCTIGLNFKILSKGTYCELPNTCTTTNPEVCNNTQPSINMVTCLGNSNWCLQGEECYTKIISTNPNIGEPRCKKNQTLFQRYPVLFDPRPTPIPTTITTTQTPILVPKVRSYPITLCPDETYCLGPQANACNKNNNMYSCMTHTSAGPLAITTHKPSLPITKCNTHEFCENNQKCFYQTHGKNVCITYSPTCPKTAKTCTGLRESCCEFRKTILKPSTPKGFEYCFEDGTIDKKIHKCFTNSSLVYTRLKYETPTTPPITIPTTITTVTSTTVTQIPTTTEPKETQEPFVLPEVYQRSKRSVNNVPKETCSGQWNQECRNLMKDGFCQATMDFTRNGNQITFKDVHDICPYSCWNCPLKKDKYIVNATSNLNCSTVQAEDCYKEVMTSECHPSHPCSNQTSMDMKCKVTNGECAATTLLGTVTDCSEKANTTLYDGSLKKIATVANISAPTTHQANVFVYDPQQTVIYGMEVTKLQYVKDGNKWMTPRDVRPLKTELLQMLQLQNITGSTEITTNITSNGTQFYTTQILARWTGNQPRLEIESQQECLSFLGKNFTEYELKILELYTDADVPGNTPLRTKQAYYSDGSYSICYRNKNAILFTRPHNHTLNSFRLITNNTQIINHTDIVEISSLDIATYIAKQTQQVTVLTNYMLITPVTYSTEDLTERNISRITTWKSQYEVENQINSNTEAILYIRRFIRESKVENSYTRQNLEGLIRQQGILPTNSLKIHQQLLGDLIVSYTCKEVTKYTPLWKRRIGNHCYHEVPIILDNGDPFEDIHKCIWYTSIPKFLTQLVRYIKPTEKITLPRKEGVETSQVNISKQNLMIMLTHLIANIREEDIHKAQPDNEKEVQNLLLKELTRQGIVYTCPFNINSKKIKFVDILTRKIQRTAQEISCSHQHATFVKHGMRYYQVDHDNGITEVSTDVYHIHVSKEINSLTTKQSTILKKIKWQEQLPPINKHYTMNEAINIQRQQNFQFTLINDKVNVNNQNLQKNTKELREALSKLSIEEQEDWHKVMNQLFTDEKKVDDFFNTTNSRLNEVTQSLINFRMKMDTLDTNLVLLQAQVQLINESLSNEIVRALKKDASLQTEVHKNVVKIKVEMTKILILEAKLKTQGKDLNILKQEYTIVKDNITILHDEQQIIHTEVKDNMNKIEIVKVKQRILENKVLTNVKKIADNEEKIEVNTKKIKTNAKDIDTQRKRITNEIQDRKTGDQNTLNQADKNAKKIADQEANARDSTTSGIWNSITSTFSSIWKGLTGGLSGILSAIWDFLKPLLMPLILLAVAILILYIAIKCYLAYGCPCTTTESERTQELLKNMIKKFNTRSKREGKKKDEPYKELSHDPEKILQSMLLAFEHGDLESSEYYGILPKPYKRFPKNQDMIDTEESTFISPKQLPKSSVSSIFSRSKGSRPKSQSTTQLWSHLTDKAYDTHV